MNNLKKYRKNLNNLITAKGVNVDTVEFYKSIKFAIECIDAISEIKKKLLDKPVFEPSTADFKAGYHEAKNTVRMALFANLNENIEDL